MITYLYLIVLLFILICLLIVITKVIQHYEAFEENPLTFGAKKYEVNSCVCTSNGKVFYFDQEKIWQEKKFVG